MSKKADEPAVYKELTADMRQGLREIYRQIYTASKALPRTRCFTKPRTN